MIEERYTYPVVLTIAGSDSSGGAGIQADLKTVAALGCYGASAITAVTVQNTRCVKAIHAIPPGIVADQIQTVMEDLKPQAIKIGMIHSAAMVEAICSTLSFYSNIPIILDPVMVSTSGKKLLNDDAVSVLVDRLIPMVTLTTPNLEETQVLAGCKVTNLAEMEAAALLLLEKKCQAVLVKGGHLHQNELYDLYMDQEGGKEVYTSERIQSTNTHGTGCTLSSAIAAYLALGFDMPKSIYYAIMYTKETIRQAVGLRLGRGKGPLNHFFDPLKTIKYKAE